MSQRTITGLENLPNMRDIQENLLNFEYNLKNELEILGACLKLVSQSTLQNIENDIQALKVQISEEIESYKEFNTQLHRRRGALTSFDVEEFNILKLKYNKLVLQVEKVYSSNPEMETLTNKFPRTKLKIESQILIGNAMNQQLRKSQNEDTLPKSTNALSRILPKPPVSSNSLISNNSSIIQTLNPMNKNTAQDMIKNIAKRDTIDENNKEFIKRELIQLKSLIQDVNKKIDTHEHTEYEMELDRLRKENNQIMHDYKILKNDNTEIMHSLRTLQKMACDIKIQNERLLLGIQNPAAYKHYTHSPLSVNPPSSNDQRAHETVFSQLQQHQPPTRLSAMSYTNANNKDSLHSPNSQKVQSNINTSKRHTIEGVTNNNNNQLLSPSDGNLNNERQSRVLTRNSSHHQTSNMTNNNKCLTEVYSKQNNQRSLIPSQQSNREENPDNEMLSSWARKRVQEQ